jgi:hypothetical protein
MQIWIGSQDSCLQDESERRMSTLCDSLNVLFKWNNPQISETFLSHFCGGDKQVGMGFVMDPTKMKKMKKGD